MLSSKKVSDYWGAYRQDMPYARTGHIRGAILLVFKQLPDSNPLNFLNKMKVLVIQNNCKEIIETVQEV